MEKDEEIIIEGTPDKNREQKTKKNCVFGMSLTLLLTFASIAFTFLKEFFAIVLNSVTAYKVLASIFFVASVGLALTSLVMLIQKKRFAFTPELILNFIALTICFV